MIAYTKTTRVSCSQLLRSRPIHDYIAMNMPALTPLTPNRARKLSVKLIKMGVSDPPRKQGSGARVRACSAVYLLYDRLQRLQNRVSKPNSASKKCKRSSKSTAYRRLHRLHFWVPNPTAMPIPRACARRAGGRAMGRIFKILEDSRSCLRDFCVTIVRSSAPHPPQCGCLGCGGAS